MRSQKSKSSNNNKFSFISLLRILLKITIFIAFVCTLILSFPFIILSFVVSLLNKRLGNRIATFFTFILWKVVQLALYISSNINFPDIPKGNYLVISNHISILDFALIARINKFMFSHAKYAFKNTLRFVPILYQGFLASNYLILKRNFEKDRENIINYVENLKKYKFPVWFVLFCEGGRFTKEKKVLCDKFCKERGIKSFKNVLSPRHKGFSMIKELLNDSYVDKVLDLTFYCDRDDFSTFNLIFTDKFYEFKCDARIIDFDSINNSEEFILEAFRRKDQLIEEWKKNKE